MRGIFVTFEGPDGCGKSTIANLVYEKLKAEYDVVKTREPGGTKISEKIRNIILDNENIEMTSRTEALLYAASRAQHVEEKILPALKNGSIVLCERFVLSSIAYQGFGRGLGRESIENINKFATGEVEPDVVFLFDTGNISSENRKLEFGGDRIEICGNEFHSRVKEAYRELAKEKKYCVIDATRGIEEVLNDCLDILYKKLEG
ncbi:dTMP kinase [Peptoniphilus sp. oral taxon 386]|uniref:dTMP kinase n=1 Tax=Peptoniphilus sp. oral taxon 386 TaxID=652713 RepID=UPI0001DA9E5C|nr:dTMP kinase [Peptoniphilus sp. oral taxon 386]EFI41478.1 dTMP kinase [Peptoniphilus sp. oral taxon 386 str. F0131]